MMNMNETDGENWIRDVIDAWIRQGKNGKSFQLEAENLESYVDLIIKAYGEYLDVVNHGGDIIDHRKLTKHIGDMVTIFAIAKDDKVAIDWLNDRCRTRFRSNGITGQLLNELTGEAAKEVRRIIWGDIEDTDAPFSVEELIRLAVYRTYNANSVRIGPGVPYNIRRVLGSLETRYITLIAFCRAVLRIYLGTQFVLDNYCTCIKRAFLRLSHGRMERITLAYYDGRRASSNEIADDLKALGRGNPTAADVDANLSGYVCPTLRRYLAEEFARAIDRLISPPPWASQYLACGRADVTRLEALCHEGIPAGDRETLFGRALVNICEELDRVGIASSIIGIRSSSK